MQEIETETKPDLVTEVEALLNDVGFRGDFETVSRPLLRRLVEEVKTLRADLKQSREDRDELSDTIEACHKMFDELDPDIEEGMTSLTPLEDRLREHLFPSDIITDDMVNGDD